jgi:aminomethyltransferase
LSSIGTAFHERTGPLNRKQSWREWSGYLSADLYADHHDIEYNAIREAAALIDVSPLYKYRVTGPGAGRLVDRVITRDATKLQVGQVYYTSWCDEGGKVLDDGTVTRLDEDTFRWTAAEPNLRWIRMNARGLDVEVEDITEQVAAVALQGPRSRAVLEAATEEPWGDLGYFRERPSKVDGMAVDVTRTGYTGDLGYELWVDVDRAVDLWDALMRAGSDHGLRPSGILAMDVARIEAGLILIDADYTSSRHAFIAEQTYSPFELGVLGRFVSFKKETEYVGRRALEREQAGGGPPRRLVGLEVGWTGLERAYTSIGLFPMVDPTASRVAVPVYDGREQVGKATSTTWSPHLKKMIGLALMSADHADAGTVVEMEWTVEARRRRTPARVVDLPFFDPPRKRAVEEAPD